MANQITITYLQSYSTKHSTIRHISIEFVYTLSSYASCFQPPNSYLKLILNEKHIFRIKPSLHISAPILSRTEDITLEKDQTFRIQCTSPEGVSWYNLPEASHNFMETLYKSPDGTFGNEMVLEGVTHESVGFYYCIKKSVFDPNAFDEQPDLLDKLVEDDDASKIYIFVRGIVL